MEFRPAETGFFKRLIQLRLKHELEENPGY